MPPVRGGIEDDVVRATLNPALEHGFERFVRGIFGIKRQIIAKYDEALRSIPQQSHELRQAFDVLAMNFDELECTLPGMVVDRGVSGLDERGLAHTPRTPEQGIVGREAA